MSLKDPDSKFDDLQARIDRARGESLPEPAPRTSGGAGGLATALRLSSELFAGVIVGGGLGYFVDRFAGTSPFGLIVFILIGFAAGTTNLVRAASRRTNGPGTPPETRSGG
ncbi:AtpZ/AtpI family protein [Enterovirga rhinocerotis]|uniref:ATP synthase protein I n=1 Tax=Enterovirga rhinocerotis TaxID=1339210 RepID=A0A4R7C957_9HYPH|nr:AtpZ/AtpI family protein [Enterovirga rhinocerotis]TDR94552.1 ATP synthase protein I [Enterovirga rhinocerotis]